jgi:hypothetical protein
MLVCPGSVISCRIFKKSYEFVAAFDLKLVVDFRDMLFDRTDCNGQFIGNFLIVVSL